MLLFRSLPQQVGARLSGSHKVFPIMGHNHSAMVVTSVVPLLLESLAGSSPPGAAHDDMNSFIMVQSLSLCLIGYE
jgi:hypothetical protein